IAHGLEARYGDLPGPARRAIQTFLLDTLGVGIAGAAHPIAGDVRRAALGWGGAGPSRIWGAGSALVTPATAAFVNGFQIHCQEYDCVHEPAVVHPMAVLLAAVMAHVDAAPRLVSGQDLCMALAVGVDLAAGLGVAARSPLRFFRPANAGLFGAVLAISRLRSFTPQQARDALGYALSFNAGTMQAHVEGKPALPLQIANAARNAIAATDLAGFGISGPQDSLEGPYGYFRLFEEVADPQLLRAALGKTWRIAEVSHKPFPTGRACQGGIALLAQAAPRIGDLADIAKIRLIAPPLIQRLVGRPWQAGMTSSYARLCFAYCGAVALRRGTVGLDDFRPDRLADKET
ncbi:MAG: MmgE/PrpD family protein, partial [Hyphomonas sp.]|uniref:MmgE/PrpD family protein n=1 Tax=Hyphomonas sp. TaxID=87 RepID=UPI0034A03DFA